MVYSDVVSHAPVGAWSKLAPLRVLSFDIECQGRKGHFPEAQHDPVIQISSVVQVQGAKAPAVQVVFTLKGCLPIVGAQVVTSATEDELLLKWRDFVQITDCDLLTGYNIQNFDVPYLLNRAKVAPACHPLPPPCSSIVHARVCPNPVFCSRAAAAFKNTKK